MVKSCCIFGCSNNKKKTPLLRFCPLPCRNKHPERRLLWLQAIKREAKDGKLWDPPSPHFYVCGEHFITGFQVNDRIHPDYVPSIFPNRKQTVSAQRRLDRFRSFAKREADRVLGPKTTRRPSTRDDGPAQKKTVAETAEMEAEPIQANDERAQLIAEIERMKIERDAAIRERDQAIRERDEATSMMKKSTGVLCANSVKEDAKKCKALTGVSWKVFVGLHSYLAQFISKKCKLPSIDQLFITLLRLRQNPSLLLLSHILGMSPATLSDMFDRWIDLLSTKLASCAIHWPQRKSMSTTVPPRMKAQFPNLTCIIDCFEIRIEHSQRPKARAKSYSNYKNWTTVKYFIACHPSGSITYLSRGWGGRASDVKIVRESDFISASYHHPGDQILADRGFTLKEDFALLGVSLLTPAFTRGKKQLPGREVEESRVLSNIRIHIERVIGVMKGRFHILDGPLLLSLVKPRADELAPASDRKMAKVDKIVHVCAALVNLSGSVVMNKNRVGDK